MVILIAESKTMLNTERVISQNEIKTSTPCFEEIAEEIVESLKEMTVGELAKELKLSSTLATKMQKMIYEFPYKSTGNQAIESYTGVVFKALDFASLSPDAKNRCVKQLRIISSLYGWLNPLDIIKPYRLDFTIKLEDGPSAGKTLNAFWKMNVTKALVNMLNNCNEREIINLLPADASKCVDWKLVKRFAKVWKVDFQEISDEGEMKTPKAEKLKSLRGSLVRQILSKGLSSASELMQISGDKYVCEGTPIYEDHFRFLC